MKRQSLRPNGNPVERYTATRQDDHRWIRGGTWTHDVGDDARIGLVSMGAADAGVELFDAKFDYVRVWTVAPRP
ncbi:MAG: hypothetical protein WKF82_08760 [Nocardioidaceae bacterium]